MAEIQKKVSAMKDQKAKAAVVAVESELKKRNTFLNPKDIMEKKNGCGKCFHDLGLNVISTLEAVSAKKQTADKACESFKTTITNFDNCAKTNGMAEVVDEKNIKSFEDLISKVMQERTAELK